MKTFLAPLLASDVPARTSRVVAVRHSRGYHARPTLWRLSSSRPDSSERLPDRRRQHSPPAFVERNRGQVLMARLESAGSPLIAIGR